jgi:signal transduction histidine kinase
MQHRLSVLLRLQSRLLLLLVLAVGVALGTVALVARASTTAEFARYVEDNRQDMQSVAQQIAATTGERLLITTTQGRVIVDSSGELLGQSLTPQEAVRLGLAPPAPAGSSVDVLFVRNVTSTTMAPPPADVWTQRLPDVPVPLQPLVSAGLPAVDDREAVFVGAVTRSLLFGVAAGGLAAVVLALAFARGILRPVGALTAAARRMEQGDLSQRVQVSSRDEIGQLAHAFNAMADGLARTEQLRRTMVADVAHELRTPLTNLRGYLEALRDGVAEPRPETIDSLYEEALLLTHLVDDLQDLSLSDAGRLSLRREAVELSALLRSTARALAPRARQHGVEVVIDMAPRLPMAYVDPQRIGQVVRNLLANALTYTPPGGTVRLHARAEGEAVRVEVCDTGCGIRPEHLPNVFERFYRADPSRARSTGGSGIGLALVKQFVEAHGGTVGVRSAAGTGCCFSFTLPTLDQAADGAGCS